MHELIRRYQEIEEGLRIISGEFNKVDTWFVISSRHGSRPADWPGQFVQLLKQHGITEEKLKVTMRKNSLWDGLSIAEGELTLDHDGMTDISFEHLMLLVAEALE